MHKLILIGSFVATFLGSVVLADWLDDVALVVTSERHWNAKAITTSIESQITHDQSVIDNLEKILSHNKDHFGAIASTALNAEIKKWQAEKAYHERVLNKFEKAHSNSELQQKLSEKFAHITNINAKIKLLEDKNTQASKIQAGALRAELTIYKTYIKTTLELY